MAQTKERSLAGPQQVAVKTQAPRLRRKLQKSVSKQRSSGARRLGPGTSNEALDDNKCDTASRGPSAQAQSCLPSVPLPSPDLSDSKWSEFFRGGGCLHYQDSASESSESLLTPLNIIPEPSHLAVRHAQPCASQKQQLPRPSSDSQTPSTRTMRHRAEPLFSTGQHDTIPRPINAFSKTSSAGLIAAPYPALLESQGSVYSDSHSEPPPSRQGNGPDALALRRQQSSDELHSTTPIHASTHLTAQADLGGSPTSDDGTLVSFEEETVYFKPVSFSPEPRSPQPHFIDQPFPSPRPAADNLSLQICLDLLTRDLSSGLASRPSRSSPETSALQVWVMIEAYERLRDQIAAARLAREELRPLETMFDMWLRALYTIHDSLTENGESDCEAELGREELD